jgi:hypothetical protein
MQLYTKIKEFQKKERSYIVQAHFKDKEINNLKNQLNDLITKSKNNKDTSEECYYNQTLLNEYTIMKNLISEKDERIKLKDEELSSIQVSQNDPQFKRLVNKCRELHKENMELFKYAQGETLENLKQENQTERNQIDQLMIKLKEKEFANKELGFELNEVYETIATLNKKLKVYKIIDNLQFFYYIGC